MPTGDAVLTGHGTDRFHHRGRRSILHMIRLLPPALILVLLSCACGPAAEAAPVASAQAGVPGQWVSGYYVAYQHDMLAPEEIDWNGLTHIVFGRVTANPDGSLNEDFDIGAPEGPELARTVSRLAHEHNRSAILMLGGAGSGGGIHAAVRDHRAGFIANLTAAMNSYGYDGIDLDWEDDLDWDLLVTFAKELREAAPGAVITFPAGPINFNIDTVNPRIPEMAPYLDQVNLMTYYPATAWSGSGWYSWHNSPLKGAKPTTPVSIEDSLARYNASGVPTEKLGMGIGFYAIGYNGGITGPDQPTTAGMIRGGDNDYPLSKLFGTGGAYRQRYRKWDPAALEPYLSLPAPDIFGCRYVSFEDEQSIREKGNFSRANGYGGIIIWTINEGYVRSHPEPAFLMEALRAGFIDPDAPRTVAVSVDPVARTVRSGQKIAFRALVTGTDSKGVNWVVAERKGGTITKQGVYTAPVVKAGAKRIVHVTATSRADPARNATARVKVTGS